MGLFGYGRKDFERNGVRMQTEIAALKDQVLKLRKAVGIGKTLDFAILMLRDIQYPKDANGKELQAIDARIFALLKKIGDDLQNKKFELASTHARLLREEIVESRKFGKEQLSEERLREEEAHAEEQARIRELMIERGKIDSRMKEIEHEADRVDENDPRFGGLEQQYELLEKKRKLVELELENIMTRRRIEDMRKMFKELPPVLSGKCDLEEIEKANEAIDQDTD